MNVTPLLHHVRNILNEKGRNGLKEVCEFLRTEIPHYNWVGFYFMNDESQILEIGPYAGAETEHTRIPYGKGICGQVAVSGQTFTVQDVHAQDNYIACSIETRAEIVVPIYRDEKLVGQIDIDSHHAEPFKATDEDFLKQVCEMVSEVL